MGRVHLGKEFLDKLNNLGVSPTDSTPYHKITVTRCGSTNSKGDFESAIESAGPVSKADAITRLKEESASARSAVL